MSQTTPPPASPEPLDANERELARLLRELPTAAPPPALDARILAAARSAVQPQVRRRPLRLWRSLGIGTAASALIATGLLLRMHQDRQTTLPLPAEVAAPATAPATATAAADTLTADSEAQAPPPKDLPPPTATATAPTAARAVQAHDEPLRTAASAEFANRPAAAAPTAFPTPAPAPAATEASAARPPPAPPPAPAPPPPAAAAADAGPAGAGRLHATTNAAALATPAAAKPSSPARAEALPPADDVAAQARDDQQSATGGARDRQGVKSGRHKQAAPAQSFPGDDAALAPAAWLDRIRARLADGDRDGARASLRRFHQHYPDDAIPDDLRVLLP
ncbi:MAG: hypothetical protein JSS45_04925 [Proteobacteria bacterium]|nr:hypothetical protein [Pseudomonadota bacterium]